MKLITAQEARKIGSGDTRDDKINAAIRCINAKIKERSGAGQTTAMMGMGMTYEALRALSKVEHDELLSDLKNSGYIIVTEGYQYPFFRLEWAEVVTPIKSPTLSNAEEDNE